MRTFDFGVSGGGTGVLSLALDLCFPPNGLRRESKPRLSGLESVWGKTAGAEFVGFAEGRSERSGAGGTGGRTTRIFWGGGKTNSSGTRVASISEGFGGVGVGGCLWLGGPGLSRCRAEGFAKGAVGLG